MLEHSYKGTTWAKHKYIRKEDGRYYYQPKNAPGSGRLTGRSKEASRGLQNDVESIQKEAKKDNRRKERVRISLERDHERKQREAEKRKQRGKHIVDSVLKRIGNRRMDRG